MEHFSGLISLVFVIAFVVVILYIPVRLIIAATSSLGKSARRGYHKVNPK